MPGAADQELDDSVLLRARDLQALRWEREGGPGIPPPQGVILCHQPGLLGSALSRWRTRPVRGFPADIRILRRTRGRVAVASRFGVGAPAAVALLEELVAFGTQSFVSIGLAGALREDLHSGTVVLAERAIGHDGTSGNYLAAAGTIKGTAGALTGSLGQALKRMGREYQSGLACSTDTPFRTTRSDVDRWVACGGLVVEMEAAGLLAAARLLRVELSAACCVADGLSPNGWRLAFDRGAVTSGMRALFEAAVTVLE